MICVRNYYYCHQKSIREVWTEILTVLTDNGWEFGEMRLSKNASAQITASVEEAEVLLQQGGYTAVCIRQIGWQDFPLLDSYTEEENWSPESVVIGDRFIIFRIVRTDENNHDRRIADILESTLQMKCAEQSSVVLFADREKHPRIRLPAWDLPFPQRELVKAADNQSAVSCSLAPLFRKMEIPASFSVTAKGSEVFLQAGNHMGHVFRLVFSSQKNSAFQSDGIRLESPVLCSGYYYVTHNALHVLHWGKEAVSRDEIRAFIAQCIRRSTSVARWLEDHAEEISDLYVPTWFDL